MTLHFFTLPDCTSGSLPQQYTYFGNNTYPGTYPVFVW
jgi:hypothetical protein